MACKPHVQHLTSLGACSDAVRFAAHYPSLRAAWRACQRGDTVTWKYGMEGGSLAPGEFVVVPKHGMVFNVADTSGA